MLALFIMRYKTCKVTIFFRNYFLFNVEIWAICESANLSLPRIVSSGMLPHYFQKKADGTEAVVAGDHDRTRVLHPAVVKIFSTMCQRHHERGE